MQHHRWWTVVSKGPAMARKYSAKSITSLDAKGTAFPAEVKKVMIGCVPTNSNMFLDEKVGTIENIDENIKSSLKAFTKKRK